MSAIVELLSVLLRIVERIIRDRKRKKRQVERNELEDNPAEFFNNHFDGVRDKPESGANEADSDSNKSGR